MKPPALSVVIPTFNAGELLAQQVEAVLTSAARWAGAVEVVIADNLSTDGAVADAVDAHRDDDRGVVRRVLAQDRRGVSHARNVGIREASSDRIAICDADDVVHDGWVPAMGGAICEETPYVTGPLDVDSLNPEWAREMRGRRVYEHPARFDDVVPFAHGCNIGIHRALVELIGPFDEHLANGGGDDIEFGCRAWRAGVQLRWEPEACVAYRFRRSLRNSYRQGRAYGEARRAVRAAAPYLPDRPDPAGTAALRRAAWLVRTLPAAVSERAVRARWIWVLSQLDGEARAFLRASVTGTVGGRRPSGGGSRA